MNCLSATYKTVPVVIRASLSFTKEEIESFTRYLINRKIVLECIIVSTCNRNEIYFDGGKDTIIKVQKELQRFKGLEWENILKYYHVYCEEKVIAHVYKVAAGMDSMVLGEDEILGQLKEAFFFARELHATGYYFNTVFQGAITSAKRIKTETRVSKLPLSIGTLVSREVIGFKKHGQKKVLLIGSTGKMGTIIRRNISKKKDVKLTGTVRMHNTMEKATDQAMEHIEYQRRYEVMDQADIIISVTTSPHYTITYEELNKAIRTRKQRLFIDLAVPLDIDKEITRIEGITLYDIDHFKEQSKVNDENKRMELNRAEALLDKSIDEMEKTMEFRQFLKVLPHVKKIFEENQLEQILYRLRDQNSSQEFATILKALKQL